MCVTLTNIPVVGEVTVWRILSVFYTITHIPEWIIRAPITTRTIRPRTYITFKSRVDCLNTFGVTGTVGVTPWLTWVFGNPMPFTTGIAGVTLSIICSATHIACWCVGFRTTSPFMLWCRKTTLITLLTQIFIHGQTSPVSGNSRTGYGITVSFA